MSDVMLFCQRMPKAELHAHLNGSLSESTLLSLYSKNQQALKGNGTIGEDEKVTLEDKCVSCMERCFQMFDIAHAVTDTPEAVEIVTRNVISEFSADGVVYLELRTTPRAVDGHMTKHQYVAAVIKAIREQKLENEIMVKLLLSLNRSVEKTEAEENLEVAIEAHKQHPDIVVGLDLSGNPAKGDAVTDFLPLLEKARSCGLKLALHCAEIPNEEEARKMIEFHADRLGHGTCIHPDYKGSVQLWNVFLESKVPLEVCLTSNVKCLTVKDYDTHHLRHLLNVSHPVAISTDDKGVFATSLSKEYSIAAQVFSLSQAQICDLGRMAINASFATALEKETLIQKLESFCKKEGVKTASS